MTRLQILKSRYDLLGKVKCYEELWGTSPGKQWASSVLHPQAPCPESAGSCRHSKAFATQPSPWTPPRSVCLLGRVSTTLFSCFPHAFLAGQLGLAFSASSLYPHLPPRHCVSRSQLSLLLLCSLEVRQWGGRGKQVPKSCYAQAITYQLISG